MQIHNIEQGTQGWYSLRAGIPTASRFGDIITPATGKLSKSAEKYANRLAAEIYIGEALMDEYVSYDMERGKIMEVTAADAYEQITDMKTERAGFITDDEHHYGCSPDRFVGEIGLVEIKCLKPENHMEYLIKQEVSRDHYPQIQGQLLVCTDREWVDWFCFHPRLPAVQVRTFRDKDYQEKLKACLGEFRDLLGEKIERLIELGYDDFMKREVKPEFDAMDCIRA